MPSKNESQARITINKKLENAGWRFFDNEKGAANIEPEKNVKITQTMLDSYGKDFENIRKGYVDYVLLDENGSYIAVLEAKSESKHPLDGKEQARQYAQSLNVRFIILSNGILSYFWDAEKDEPEIIVEFPTQESLSRRAKIKMGKRDFIDEKIDENYIASTQKANFQDDPSYKDARQRDDYIRRNRLRILRPYQLSAVLCIQEEAQKGKERFLFEMATGTGKTLISAAIIKLFLKTNNAKRILFLVDRIELEEQAAKNFNIYLGADFQTVIYKQNRGDWKKADIVVSTVQTLASQNKYKTLFSPADFDLIIADESHRAIAGNARAVFEYFIGYKLGLTATPKDYLKNLDASQISEMDPRLWERRQLLDTYTTFGCKNSEPTFRYSLENGVKDGYLVSPLVLTVKTEITTQLLSDSGFAVLIETNAEEERIERFFHTDFEKRFFSTNTNESLCRAFMENALKDPISGEIGKTIVFCVSQKHASKITDILNRQAAKMFPGKYNSGFAVQITSNIANSQEYSRNFANNNLNGHSAFLENYKTSKTRVCITVGMMTTGYDCEDLLNIAWMRPIFSPTDFIQIKGRGTRKWIFEWTDADKNKIKREKNRFKIFDFFRNYDYFEKDFKYDEAIELPPEKGGNRKPGDVYPPVYETIEITRPDPVVFKSVIDPVIMKIDRKFFESAQDKMRADLDIAKAVEDGEWERAVQIVKDKYDGKPELYITLENIRQSIKLDRSIDWREFLEHSFGLIRKIKTKDEKLEEEWEKFISISKIENENPLCIKNYLKSYLTDSNFRQIIDKKEFAKLSAYPGFDFEDLKQISEETKNEIERYIKDYVPLQRYNDDEVKS